MLLIQQQQHQHNQSQQMVEMNRQMSHAEQQVREDALKPSRTAISSLSQSYPSNSAGVTASKIGTNKGHLQPLLPHKVSLGQTLENVHEQHDGVVKAPQQPHGLAPVSTQAAHSSNMLLPAPQQHHIQHRSLGSGVGAAHRAHPTPEVSVISNNYPQHVIHTAKASQKQTRLKSPLTQGFLQDAAQKNGYAAQIQGAEGNNALEYSHTIDVNRGRDPGAAIVGADPTGQQQRDESDLGDLDDDDESRALFHQLVPRTNLGLNRKPSNTTSLSGTMLPQKKGITQTSQSSRTVQNNQLGPQSHHFPAQSVISSGQFRQGQSQEFKQQIRKANEAGIKHASLIKQKLFVLEAMRDGDQQLMSVLVANQGCSCESSSCGDEDDDQSDFGSLERQRKESYSKNCKHMEFSKSSHALIIEISQLIRAVTTDQVWPFLSGNAAADNGELLVSEEFAGVNTNHIQVINDAFKEAFVSQLSYFDMIDLLEMTVEVDSESIACTTLRLINQLAEKNLNIQQEFITAGLIQKLVKFTGHDSPREIKVEVAYFVGQVFSDAKELNRVYMACRGFEIQLSFIRLTRPDCFADNHYLIMFAIDSILVMFEESPNGQNQSAQSKAQQTQPLQPPAQTGKRHLTHSQPPTSLAGMTYADLAKTLTQSGIIEPLARQIPNFIHLAQNTVATEFSYQSTNTNSTADGKEQQTAMLYLERIFDILIDLAICGEHSVRKALCSQSVMGHLLTRVVHAVAHGNVAGIEDSEAEVECVSLVRSPLQYMLAKWYVKLIIALTVSNSSNTQASSTSHQHQQQLDVIGGSSQLVIFELLGRSSVVVLLSQLVPLYVEHHAISGGSSESSSSNYLATLYESLKLLNLLGKMSPNRCEQACHQGELVPALHQLITYVEMIQEPPQGEEIDEAGFYAAQTLSRSPAQMISRSKKSRLVNTSLQLLHELVIASLATRTALLNHAVPALLLRLLHLKAVSYTSALAQSTQLHHSQNKSQGAHRIVDQRSSVSQSLQCCQQPDQITLHRNMHLDQQSSLSTQHQAGINLRNAMASAVYPSSAAQDQETIGRILDIFVVWVQQDDQTGQILQEILANQHSLETIFSLISKPRRQKSAALFSFFNALNRILLASDRVTDALLLQVHLILHLGAILSFLCGQLASLTSVETVTTMIADNSSVAPAHRLFSNSRIPQTAQCGQTGTTPLQLQPGLSEDSEDIILQQSRLVKDWQDCYPNTVNTITVNTGNTNSHENLPPNRVRSRERRGLTLANERDSRAPSLLSSTQQTQTLSMQQTTQMLKELLEIFQLLVQAQNQADATYPRGANFMMKLDIKTTINQVLSIASKANFVILQSMANQLLSQIDENKKINAAAEAPLRQNNESLNFSLQMRKYQNN